MKEKRDSIRRLLIVSEVVHYHHEQQWFAFGAYAREIDIWADLFPCVTIAAPCQTGPPPGDCLPITRSNIAFAPLLKTNGNNKSEKIRQLFVVVPQLAWKLARTLCHADAIQVRCPAHVGLLAALLAPFFSRYRMARYTATWNGYHREPWIWRLQRAVLRSGWWKGPVLVYGHWPDQPPHVITIFTSVLTDLEIERAKAAALKKRPLWTAESPTPLTVLFVGRLSAWKNVDVLVSAVAALVKVGVPLKCHIVGEGPERPALEKQAGHLGVRECIEFVGGVPLERVLEYYERSDVLVLASETEGWAKVIVEGMAFGLICIGSDQGIVPTILGDGRGLIVPPRDVTALTSSLRRIAAAPDSFESMRERAANWAQQYSIQGLREVFRGILKTSWRTSIGTLPESANTPGNPTGI